MLWTDVVQALASSASVFVAAAGVATAIVGLVALYRQIGHATMGGFLQLYLRWEDLQEDSEVVRKAIANDWNKKSPEEILALLEASTDTKKSSQRLASFFETLAILVRTCAFPRNLARQSFGGLTATWWQRLKPLIAKKRIAQGNPRLYEHFEWLVGQISSP